MKRKLFFFSVVVLLVIVKNNDGRFLLLKLNSLDGSGLETPKLHDTSEVPYNRGI